MPVALVMRVERNRKEREYGGPERRAAEGLGTEMEVLAIKDASLRKRELGC